MILFTIRNIIVPVDLSETSLNALHTAIFLAEKHKARLYILNVAEKAFDHLSDSNNNGNTRLSNISDVLTALVTGREIGDQKNITLVQEEGNVTEHVIKLSLKVQADLIVLGTHGASGFREGFIGTNAYSIIKYATCPVLTIPSGRNHTFFKKAMFPVRIVNGALMRYDFARQLLSGNAVLEVFGLSSLNMERDTSVLEKMIGEIRTKTGDEKTEFRTGWSSDRSVSEEVLHQAQRSMSDLIILTPVLDAAIKQNFIGPHMQRIINCAKVPVLTIKKQPVRTAIPLHT